MQSVGSRRFGWWRMAAVLVAILAVGPLIHVHPIGDHDRSLADPSKSLCGLCVNGVVIDDHVPPEVLAAPQLSGSARSDELPAATTPSVRSTPSRAPPVAI
jgi:hypothetical protein